MPKPQRSPIVEQPQPTLGKVNIRVEWCKGCELCVDYCPTDVLVMSSDFNDKGHHYPLEVGDNCILCQSCYIICPEFAIFAVPRDASADRDASPVTA